MTSPQQKQVQIFYVPFTYTGFTESLLKKAISETKGNDYSNILYLAPTPRKIKDCRNIFHKLVTGSYIPPNMITIKQFSKWFYSFYVEKLTVSRSLMPIIISLISGKGIGFSKIISDFIDEMKQYRPDKDIDTIQNELKDIFKELNIPEDGYQRALEAIEIFKRYQEILKENNVADENDILKECPDLIERHNYVPNTLILDSFYEVTPIEEPILKRLISKAKVTLISIPYSKNYLDITNSFSNFIKCNFNIKELVLDSKKGREDIPYVSYPDIDSEVEGIARHIKNLFISGKFKSLNDITLTFPNLQLYSDIVQRVFKRYGIPCTFLVSKPLGKTKPFLDLISLLESVEDDYPRLQFLQFITSPFFKKMPEIFREYIPQISIISGIIKGKDLWFNISRSFDLQSSIFRDVIPDLEKELRWIFKKLSPLENIRFNGAVKEFCEALEKIINELDFSDDNINVDEIMSKILKELSLADKIIPDSNKGLRHFIDSLKHLLNSTDIELEGAGVNITGCFELRGTESGYLYFGGLKDGDIPSMPDIDHILPDSARTRLGLVNLKKYLHLQKFLFQWLIDSSENIHLTYPSMEADKFFLPSPFLPWKSGGIEHIPGILCKEEDLIVSGKSPLSNYIKEINSIRTGYITKKFGSNSYIRVTDVDNYRSCPRRFFIEKILNLEPLEIKEYEIEAMLLGTIIHEIMEGIVSKSFKTYDELKMNAERILSKTLSKQPIDEYWKHFVRDSFFSILPDIYDIECELIEQGYSFMKAEVPVEGEIIKGIRLKGKIDRVDKKVVSSQQSAVSQEKTIDSRLLTEDSVVQLIDYKTGTAQLNRSDILKKGASLQLFLYASLMKSLGFDVNRVGIYSLKDLKISSIPNKTDKREGITMDDYIVLSLRYLEDTVNKIRGGDFTALPINEQICKTCHERAFCPYIQTG
jgi:ATP-dependent helicase/DNAse subunit B